MLRAVREEPARGVVVVRVEVVVEMDTAATVMAVAAAARQQGLDPARVLGELVDETARRLF